jgi:acetyl esterase/lipase
VKLVAVRLLIRPTVDYLFVSSHQILLPATLFLLFVEIFAMSLKSQLSIPDPAVFHPSAISEKTNAFNEKLMDIMRGAPRWYEVGAEKYRQMRAAGETPLPKAVLLDSATSYSITSRDGNSIPCRILKPQNGPVKSVFMHIHGGGWVLQDEKSQDLALQTIADATGLLCISVGYRLAPEHPFPAGPNDCYDAAEYLVDNAETEFGAKLGFLGGESAGAHLSVLVALHLVQSSKNQHSSFSFKGLLLHFGAYDLSWTPSVYNFKKPETLVLDRDLMDHFIEVFLPGMTHEEKKHPSVSPLYANLMGLKLPPALFTCGTEDCLLDDTMFMATKWMMAGGDTIVKIIPGGCHGYVSRLFVPSVHCFRQVGLVRRQCGSRRKDGCINYWQ